MSDEALLISELAATNPGAVELARVVSLAVLIEPWLLRRARLRLLSGVDAGAEADLWLSRLVQTRSPRGITLQPRVAQLLREALADEPDMFERAWRLTEEMHAAGPQTVIQEEKINRLSARLDDAAREEIERLLDDVAETLSRYEERSGLLNWLAAALPRLPDEVRNLGAARELAQAAYFRLSADLPLDEKSTGAVLPEWVSWAMPKGIEEVDLGVQLVEGGVLVGGPAPPDNIVKVPATNPLVVELSWADGGHRHVRQVRLRRGQRRKVDAPPVEIQVRNARGVRYLISPARRPEPAREAERKDGLPVCFVVMGFGKKTDFETGRTLDLDKTYHNIIKRAVKAAGFECLRADEIPHSGLIDVPMYRQLLEADIVIADISASNRNAYYELGVRHGLRPHSTVVICEDGAKGNPFDVSGVRVMQYHHMGVGVDFEEVERFRDLLTDALKDISGRDPRPTDSPVYTFLPGLRPPVLEGAARADAPAAAAPAYEESRGGDSSAFADLFWQVDEAIKDGDFATAKALLARLRRRMRDAARGAAEAAGARGEEFNERPEDPYVIQRLAFATYKSRLPNPRAALEEARDLLLTLSPATSNDPETLGLWGTVHKRLWDETKDVRNLDEAVRGYERGFYLKNDHYNGINLAFILNVRAANAHRRAEAIADFVQAERVRREVIKICEALLGKGGLAGDGMYWVLATMAEAHLGTGDWARAEEKLKEAESFASADWMKSSTAEQMDKLRALLADSPLKYVREDAP